MVGPMMLFKMLHCKHLRKSSKEYSGEGTSYDSQRQINVKKEHDESLCRVCLKEGSIPIHDHEEIPEALNMFGGIYVSTDDPYPKYLCSPCHMLLQGAILLRKTAQQSEEILKQSVENIGNDDDNGGVDLDASDEDFYPFELYKQPKKPAEKKQKEYYCRKCDMEFKTSDEYADHRLSTEHENLRHTCLICNKSYKAEYFKKHMAVHSDNPPYMCDICGKKFHVQNHFSRHRVTHFYNLPYQCSLCPYKGRFSESLKMHMRSHTGEKPYQCEQCPSRFINKSNLNKHTLTHKGQHDYKCDSCGRGFYTKRDLELHFKVDHTGVKDHICNMCGKAFGYRKQMMKHQLKVHKREKLKSGRMPLYVKVELMKQTGDVVTDD